MKKILVMFTLVTLLFSSCYPDPQVGNDGAQTNISLDKFYADFEYEASLRGVDINIENLDLISRIEEIEEEGVAGTCHFNSHQSNIVTIDQSFWNSASSNQKEMVVFHELGHCVLGRDHREEENNENACLSIMNSGTTGCQIFYNETNREYYLDELFTYSE